jgi:hypothetical protein
MRELISAPGAMLFSGEEELFREAGEVSLACDGEFELADSANAKVVKKQQEQILIASHMFFMIILVPFFSIQFLPFFNFSINSLRHFYSRCCHFHVIFCPAI